MSSDRQRALELRRQQLQLRSAELRAELRQQAQPLAAPLVWADRARGAWDWLGRHPEVPLAGLAVLVVLRPSRTLRWASRAWWAWGVLSRARRLLG